VNQILISSNNRSRQLHKPTGSHFDRTVAESLTYLRNDALSLGMKDLAIVYGWSVIRLKAQEINEQALRLSRYK
jgi:hypothetical protein